MNDCNCIVSMWRVFSVPGALLLQRAVLAAGAGDAGGGGPGHHEEPHPRLQPRGQRHGGHHHPPHGHQGQGAGLWVVRCRPCPLTRAEVLHNNLQMWTILSYLLFRETFKTKLQVVGTEPGPAPDTTAFIQRLEEEKRRQEKGEVTLSSEQYIKSK